MSLFLEGDLELKENDSFFSLVEWTITMEQTYKMYVAFRLKPFHFRDIKIFVFHFLLMDLKLYKCLKI